MVVLSRFRESTEKTVLLFNPASRILPTHLIELFVQTPRKYCGENVLG